MKKLILILFSALILTGCTLHDKEYRGEITYYAELTQKNEVYYCEISLNNDPEIYRGRIKRCSGAKKGDQVILTTILDSDDISTVLVINEEE